MPRIHPTSYVSPEAQLGQNVQIGPFCVVEAETVIGDRCRLESHAVVKTGTEMGSDNYVADGAVLGGLPQHKRAPSAPGRLRIGSGNTIREQVTLHRALSPDTETAIGDNNLLMVGSHVAHDCRLGNDVILANNVLLAGHVTVGDRAYLSGAVAVHQFCRIGELAMVGGQAHVTKDIPPFVTIDGVSSGIVGLNLVGLRRAGFGREEIDVLKQAYRIAFRSGLRWEEILNVLQQRFAGTCAEALYGFMSKTQRGCVQERTTPRTATIRLYTGELESSEVSTETGETNRPRTAA